MNHDDVDLTGCSPRPARLLWLENRDAVISSTLHELTRQRTRNKEEATRLRISMTPEERAEYERMKCEEIFR